MYKEIKQKSQCNLFTSCQEKKIHLNCVVLNTQKHLSNLKVHSLGTSLVVQWLRIHLPVQGTQIRSLVQEDPTCRGATKPVRHNYWACALEPASHNYWAHVPQLLSPHATTTEAHAHRARAPQREATAMRSPHAATRERPRAAVKTQRSQK